MPFELNNPLKFSKKYANSTKVIKYEMYFKNVLQSLELAIFLFVVINSLYFFYFNPDFL